MLGTSRSCRRPWRTCSRVGPLADSLSSCLSNIDEQVKDADGAASEYRISGVLYCVAALVELNSTGGVSLSDLEFSGRIDWQLAQ